MKPDYEYITNASGDVLSDCGFGNRQRLERHLFAAVVDLHGRLRKLEQQPDPSNDVTTENLTACGECKWLCTGAGRDLCWGVPVWSPSDGETLPGKALVPCCVANIDGHCPHFAEKVKG